MNKSNRLLLSLFAVFALALPPSAGAVMTNDLGTYAGPQINFTLIEETTQDPLFGPSDDGDAPLYGAPSGSGNSLVFTPGSFIADSANGNGGTVGDPGDEDHATLNIELQSVNPLVDGIETINLSEFGDFTLDTLPPGGTTPGTMSTFVFMQMTGAIQVLEVSDGATVTDVSGLALQYAIEGVFDIGALGTGSTTVFLDSVQGTGTWSALDSLDVNALLAGDGQTGVYATKVSLALDNKLWAFSESGTAASVQKKIAGPGLIIEVIPEPATGLLFAAGLIGLGIRSRRTHV